MGTRTRTTWLTPRTPPSSLLRLLSRRTNLLSVGRQQAGQQGERPCTRRPFSPLSHNLMLQIAPPCPSFRGSTGRPSKSICPCTTTLTELQTSRWPTSKLQQLKDSLLPNAIYFY